jgi:cobalt-zinc-cadmium resistance protein CzcA
MIKFLMDLALKERAVVIGAALILVAAGLYAFHELDIEAYPDPVQPRIEIITQPAGLSAEEVEKLTTIPLEVGLAGVRNLQSMRTISEFGLSDIKLYFDWDSDFYWDRVETINRLGLVTLPPGMSPGISPDNPIGEIYRYTIESPNHDLTQEKEIEDWIVEKQMKTVPGVEDVSGFGGLTKEYHVDVDADALSHYKVSLGTLNNSIANANINVGGSYLAVGDQAFDVRGIGFIQNLEDINNITLTANGATPVRVRDVAEVSIGHAPRLGIVGMNDQNEVVEGTILMRKFGDTLKTLAGVEKKVHDLNTSNIFPKGVKIVPYYDRTQLVDATLHTVFENLGVGMALVFVVLMFFLGDLRTAIIAAVNIPLAMLGANIVLYLTNTSANLLSLGAIDFGIIIDSTIIVVENIFRHLSTDHWPDETTLQCIRRASGEVGEPMLYSTTIFIIAFLPLFTMRGVEGVIFSPMSHTYAYALSIGILLAVTVSPVLCSYLLHVGIKETHNVVWESFHTFYHNLFVKILQRPRLTVGIIVGVLVAGLSLFPFLGGEFLPKLEEGNIWARATLPLTSSLANSNRVAGGARRIFQTFPEVGNVISQVGRPDDGTDTAGFSNIEFMVDLKPQKQWRHGLTKPKLIAQIDEQMHKAFPEANFGYSQNIEDNVEEAMSGVKGDNAVKVYGPDLAVDERIASEVNDVLSKVPGMADLAVYRAMGQPNLQITPDRQVCSRYGINVGDVNAIVQAAIGGQAVTQVFEGERTFSLIVRWQPKYRQSLDAIRQIKVAIPSGGYIPLAQVADIRTAEGASIIYREALRRYVPLRFSVRGRDLKSAILEAKRQVAQQVQLPEGVTLDWAGQYNELQEANHRLAVIIPIALLLIMGVLYAATKSILNTLILMAQVPVACLGGILALAITGTPFSISAAVGFISIFAISIMDGILLNFYIRQLWEEGHTVLDSIVMGADRRFRAVMMTALVSVLGLSPAALSTKIGAQTQKPLAIVVIGGAIAIALLTRVFMPTLVYLLHRQLGLRDDVEGRPNKNGEKK